MIELEEIKSALHGVDNTIKESGLDPREVSDLLDSLRSIAESLSSVACASVDAEECGATPFEYIGHQLSNINGQLGDLNKTISDSTQLIAKCFLRIDTEESV